MHNITKILLHIHFGVPETQAAKKLKEQFNVLKDLKTQYHKNDIIETLRKYEEDLIEELLIIEDESEWNDLMVKVACNFRLPQGIQSTSIDIQKEIDDKDLILLRVRTVFLGAFSELRAIREWHDFLESMGFETVGYKDIIYPKED